MSKDIKIITVTYQEYTDIDFTDPATYFIVDALQNYIYFCTRDRVKAQEKCNEMYGVGKYTVKASKLVKTKSKLESGGMSVVATATRARPSSRAPK